MQEIVKDYLLNLFFVLFPIIALPLWIEEKNVSDKFMKHTLPISSAIAVILCITFPVHTDSDNLYDLRQVPIWIGSLYGGPLVSFLLFAITVLYRSFFGGSGVFVAFITALFQMIVSILIHKKFLSLSANHKILFTIVLCAASNTIFAFATTLTGYHSLIWYFFIPFQIVSVVMTSYLFEALQRSIEFRKRIIRAEKMEVVSHLAASISHEVRNPLTASRGFMQLLLQNHVSPEKRKEYIRVAIEEIDRAESIITDYLTFAKPAPESVEKLNVKIEIEKVVDLLRPLANMNSVEIHTSLVPFNVKGERDKFRQCLLNIIKNSIEAMPNGGLLDIYVSIEKENVLIRITDTGVGMTDEQIDRLGEPYFTTKGTKGTGLGMMVVYRVIETMNGTIDITSEVNKGTRVSVYLPLLKAEWQNQDEKVKSTVAAKSY